MKRKEIERIAFGEYSFSVDKVFDCLHNPTGECTVGTFEDMDILEKCEINHLISMNLIEENLLKTVDGFKFCEEQKEEQKKEILADKIANRAWNKCDVQIKHRFHSSECVEFHTVPLKPGDYTSDEITKVCEALLSISNGEG